MIKNLNSFYGLPLPLIAAEGDSHTAGSQLSAGEVWISQLHTLLGGASQWSMLNFGVGGQTVTQMTSDASSQVDVRFRSGRTNVLFVWGGANDLQAADTAQTVYDRLESYCLARLAARDWQIITFTLTPASHAQVPPGREAERIDLNDMIRAGYTGWAHRLVDLGANSVLGDYEDTLNTTYFQDDQSHMKPAAHTIIRDLAHAQLITL